MVNIWYTEHVFSFKYRSILLFAPSNRTKCSNKIYIKFVTRFAGFLKNFKNKFKAYLFNLPPRDSTIFFVNIMKSNSCSKHEVKVAVSPQFVVDNQRLARLIPHVPPLPQQQIECSFLK